VDAAVPQAARRRRAEPRPGTLQLCAGNSCLVDARVTFAAYNVASDCRKLRAHHGIEVASTLELRSAGVGREEAVVGRQAPVQLSSYTSAISIRVVHCISSDDEMNMGMYA
jgi:hypothetical protein